MAEIDDGSWTSYPKVYALGHAAVEGILADPVDVTEKIDGSQFSFGLFADGLRCRSKGAVMLADAPEKMFTKAVETAKALDLRPGWTYRAEYLAKPRHGALAYDRVPGGHLILFDVTVGLETYLDYGELCSEAGRLGLEVVTRIFHGNVINLAMFQAMLELTSALGGQKVEGVVVKNYLRFGRDKKVLMAKFVSEKFKEIHGAEWRAANPKQGDILERLGGSLRTPARWEKALLHLAERGLIEGEPRDIAALVREVPGDIQKECEEEIRAALWDWAWPHLRRSSVRGLAEWYKGRLAERAFASKEGGS